MTLNENSTTTITRDNILAIIHEHSLTDAIELGD